MKFSKKMNYAPDLYRAILIELEFTVNFTNRLNFNDPIVNSIFHLNRTINSQKHGREKSFNHDSNRAFRLVNTEGKKAYSTGLLVLTFSSLYASLLIANNDDRDLRHIILMKMVTYYDYYLTEIDTKNAFANVEALNLNEIDYMAEKMRDPNNGFEQIAPERYKKFPPFVLTSAMFKFVFAYLHKEHNIYNQQRILDLLDLYMSSYSYIAFSLGLGACYHASLAKIDLESQAPFWFFRFDLTDQHTRSLSYIVDHYVYNPELGLPENYYKLGRLFANSGKPLHEFARSVKHLGTLACFPRREEQKEFFQEQINKQKQNYPESFNFIVDSLRKAYARILHTMEELREKQQDPNQGINPTFTSKDPELNLDAVIDLNSYLKNKDDPLYFANHVYHLADIYTNCTELPDYVAIDYNSPDLLDVFIDSYGDEQGSVYVPAFVEPKAQALAPVVLQHAHSVLAEDLNSEQQEFVKKMISLQTSQTQALDLAQDYAPQVQAYQENVAKVLDEYTAMRSLRIRQREQKYTPEQLEFLKEAYKNAFANYSQRKKGNKEKYFLASEVLPQNRVGALKNVKAKIKVSLSELLTPTFAHQDKLALVAKAQSQKDRQFRGKATPEGFGQIDKLLEAKQTKPESAGRPNLEQALFSHMQAQQQRNARNLGEDLNYLNSLKETINGDFSVPFSEPEPEVKAPERKVKKVVIPKNKVMRVSRSARKRGKK
ncbi:hypothetical protein CJP74_01180 [Psittacicella melopsittaci]|uniref:Uncharacterized protein n=2 Tax=Psittacicella melopsittaci TaxID=2028576 RepID=A0A3A1Y8V7_9GAMM|nr:hypothetical protein CJP74_01180 [Psittacicella melopsittaci]